jgi:hypothetical protein
MSSILVLQPGTVKVLRPADSRNRATATYASQPTWPVNNKCVNALQRWHSGGYSWSEAQFIVPDWGLEVGYGIGCRTGPSGYIGWRHGTTTLCHSRFYPPERDYEFGYSIPANPTQRPVTQSPMIVFSFLTLKKFKTKSMNRKETGKKRCYEVFT